MDTPRGRCWNCGSQTDKKCSKCILANYCTPNCENKDKLRHFEECVGAGKVKELCNLCGNTIKEKNLSSCSICCAVSYCSEICKQRHSKIHEDVCKYTKDKIVEMGRTIEKWNRRIKTSPQYLGRLVHATDFLKLDSNEGSVGSLNRLSYSLKAVSVLMFGADIKHLFHTFASLPTSYNFGIEFTSVDSSPHLISRNILLLYLLQKSCQDPSEKRLIEQIIFIFYSLRLDFHTFSFLRQALEVLSSLSYLHFIHHFSDKVHISEESFKKIQSIWKGWSSFSRDENALEKLIKVRSYKISSSDVQRTIRKVVNVLPESQGQTFSYWFEHGTFASLSDEVYANVTLASFNPYNDQFSNEYPDIKPELSDESSFIANETYRDDMIYSPFGTDLIFQDWDFGEVMKFSRDGKEDLLQSYKEYIKMVLRKAGETFINSKDIKIGYIISEFFDSHTECFVPNEVRGKYDRICTGLLADVTGVPKLLTSLSPFLNKDNPYSRLISHHRLWCTFAEDKNSLALKKEWVTNNRLEKPINPWTKVATKWAVFKQFLQAETMCYRNQIKAYRKQDEVPKFSDISSINGIKMSNFLQEQNSVFPFRFKVDKRYMTMTDSKLYTLEWKAAESKPVCNKILAESDKKENIKVETKISSQEIPYTIINSAPTKRQNYASSKKENTLKNHEVKYLVPSTSRTKKSQFSAALNRTSVPHRTSLEGLNNISNPINQTYKHIKDWRAGFPGPTKSISVKNLISLFSDDQKSSQTMKREGSDLSASSYPFQRLKTRTTSKQMQEKGSLSDNEGSSSKCGESYSGLKEYCDLSNNYLKEKTANTDKICSKNNTHQINSCQPLKTNGNFNQKQNFGNGNQINSNIRERSEIQKAEYRLLSDTSISQLKGDSVIKPISSELQNQVRINKNGKTPLGNTSYSDKQNEELGEDAQTPGSTKEMSQLKNGSYSQQNYFTFLKQKYEENPNYKMHIHRNIQNGSSVSKIEMKVEGVTVFSKPFKKVSEIANIYERRIAKLSTGRPSPAKLTLPEKKYPTHDDDVDLDEKSPVKPEMVTSVSVSDTSTETEENKDFKYTNKYIWKPKIENPQVKCQTAKKIKYDNELSSGGVQRSFKKVEVVPLQKIQKTMQNRGVRAPEGPGPKEESNAGSEKETEDDSGIEYSEIEVEEAVDVMTVVDTGEIISSTTEVKKEDNGDSESQAKRTVIKPMSGLLDGIEDELGESLSGAEVAGVPNETKSSVPSSSAHSPSEQPKSTFNFFKIKPLASRDSAEEKPTFTILSKNLSKDDIIWSRSTKCVKNDQQGAKSQRLFSQENYVPSVLKRDGKPCTSRKSLRVSWGDMPSHPEMGLQTESAEGSTEIKISHRAKAKSYPSTEKNIVTKDITPFRSTSL